jgi:uncharacterized membrane protein YkvA (DUF1232 family)
MAEPKRETWLGSPRDIMNDVRMAWRLFQDRRVPALAKAIPMLSLLYVIMPFDLIPDWLLGLGQLDDLVVVALGLKFFVAVASPILNDRDQTDEQKDAEEPEATESFIDGTYRVVDDASFQSRPTRKL